MEGRAGPPSCGWHRSRSSRLPRRRGHAKHTPSVSSHHSRRARRAPGPARRAGAGDHHWQSHERRRAAAGAGRSGDSDHGARGLEQGRRQLRDRRTGRPSVRPNRHGGRAATGLQVADRSGDAHAGWREARLHARGEPAAAGRGGGDRRRYLQLDREAWQRAQQRVVRPDSEGRRIQRGAGARRQGAERHGATAVGRSWRGLVHQHPRRQLHPRSEPAALYRGRRADGQLGLLHVELQPHRRRGRSDDAVRPNGRHGRIEPGGGPEPERHRVGGDPEGSGRQRHLRLARRRRGRAHHDQVWSRGPDALHVPLFVIFRRPQPCVSVADDVRPRGCRVARRYHPNRSVRRRGGSGTQVRAVLGPGACRRHHSL